MLGRTRLTQPTDPLGDVRLRQTGGSTTPIETPAASLGLQRFKAAPDSRRMGIAAIRSLGDLTPQRLAATRSERALAFADAWKATNPKAAGDIDRLMAHGGFVELVADGAIDPSAMFDLELPPDGGDLTLVITGLREAAGYYGPKANEDEAGTLARSDAALDALRLRPPRDRETAAGAMDELSELLTEVTLLPFTPRTNEAQEKLLTAMKRLRRQTGVAMSRFVEPGSGEPAASVRTTFEALATAKQSGVGVTDARRAFDAACKVDEAYIQTERYAARADGSAASIDRLLSDVDPWLSPPDPSAFPALAGLPRPALVDRALACATDRKAFGTWLRGFVEEVRGKGGDPRAAAIAVMEQRAKAAGFEGSFTLEGFVDSEAFHAIIEDGKLFHDPYFTANPQTGRHGAWAHVFQWLYLSDAMPDGEARQLYGDLGKFDESTHVAWDLLLETRTGSGTTFLTPEILQSVVSAYLPLD